MSTDADYQGGELILPDNLDDVEGNTFFLFVREIDRLFPYPLFVMFLLSCRLGRWWKQSDGTEQYSCWHAWQMSLLWWRHERSSWGILVLYYFCLLDFDGWLLLILHQSDFQNGEFSCLDCNKQFKLKSSLERHRRVIHAEGDTYSCPECNARCPDKGTLARHMYTHTGISSLMNLASVWKSCIPFGLLCHAFYAPRFKTLWMWSL